MGACRHVETAGDTRRHIRRPPLATCRTPPTGCGRQKSRKKFRAPHHESQRVATVRRPYTITVRDQSATTVQLPSMRGCPQTGLGGAASPNRRRRPSADHRTHYVPLVRTSRPTATACDPGPCRRARRLHVRRRRHGGPSQNRRGRRIGGVEQLRRAVSPPSPDSHRLQGAVDCELGGTCPESRGARVACARGASAATMEAFRACLGTPWTVAVRSTDGGVLARRAATERPAILYSCSGQHRASPAATVDADAYRPCFGGGGAVAALCVDEAFSQPLLWAVTTSDSSNQLVLTEGEVTVGTTARPSFVPNSSWIAGEVRGHRVVMPAGRPRKPTGT